MSKLGYEDKINIYNNKKEGMSIKALSKKYDVRDNVIKYLVRVIDKHGYEVLRTNKNNYYSPNQKEQIKIIIIPLIKKNKLLIEY